MIGRVAALLILLSQILLLTVVFDPTGMTAIWFSFLGHPLLGVGILMGLISIARRANARGSDGSDPNPVQ